MQKKCIICLKTLSIESFPKQWDQKIQKYYTRDRCIKCWQIRQKEYFKNPAYKKTREKYWSQGFYGWNIKLEEAICRRDNRLKNEALLNIWEKKCDNLSEISSVLSNIFNRKKFLPRETEQQLYLKLVERVKKNMFIRLSRKITELDLITETIYSRISATQRMLMQRYSRNIWKKKVYYIEKSLQFGLLKREALHYAKT